MVLLLPELLFSVLLLPILLLLVLLHDGARASEGQCVWTYGAVTRADGGRSVGEDPLVRSSLHGPLLLLAVGICDSTAAYVGDGFAEGAGE